MLLNMHRGIQHLVVLSVCGFLCICFTKITNLTHQIDNDQFEHYQFNDSRVRNSYVSNSEYQQICSRYDVDLKAKNVPWAERSLFHRANISDPSMLRFHQVLSITEMETMMKMLKVFIETCEKNSIMFHIQYGTLIGAVRHFGMIPWDDDIDVRLSVNDKKKIAKAFENKTEFTFYNDKYPWKLVWNAKKFKHANKKWPFIDIFPYNDNGTDVCDAFSSSNCLPREYIFPLAVHPYESFVLPIPNNPVKTLEFFYKANVFKHCSSLYFSHLLSKYQNTSEIDCAKLHPYLPFVVEERFQGCVRRTLIHDKKIIGSKIMRQ